MTTNILAHEILAHTTQTRALAIGDLAVVATFNAKQIGCKVVRMWAAGEISTDAQVEIQIVGTQGCYRNGMKLTVDASSVTRAI